TELDLVLPILASAIGDSFVPKERLNEKQGVYPLDTYLCTTCGHLQNLDIINPDILFRNYIYRTSSSLGLVDHFKRYAAEVSQALQLPSNSLVVEIGSNDGSLLKAFKELGMKVRGVDPARAIAAVATEAGIPTIPDFFTSALAKTIAEENGLAKLICANNIFAHADNLTDIVLGTRSLLTPDGVFVFEVSYVPDMIDGFVFDTIYHEHVSHHALLPLERFFNRLDMTLFDVTRIKTKGGSIRGFAQPISTGKRPKSELLKTLMKEEERRGITKPKIYHDFYQALEGRKRATLAYLDKAIQEGKKIVAYGASTTTTTLLYHFELGTRIGYIIDDNPIKQNLFSPGFHLPVLASSELYVRRPDLVVILAWNYADIIIQKNQRLIDEGGVFLVPLPTLKVVG
ncbi:MAG TPA: class I SAM-dependent methyltransferase, partial [Gammaproteobacteria bacterium]|nr:class I SAM-dependent methyltransferase [Gammaproteobacteria bacterium]